MRKSQKKLDPATLPAPPHWIRKRRIGKADYLAGRPILPAAEVFGDDGAIGPAGDAKKLVPPAKYFKPAAAALPIPGTSSKARGRLGRGTTLRILVPPNGM